MKTIEIKKTAKVLKALELYKEHDSTLYKTMSMHNFVASALINDMCESIKGLDKKIIEDVFFADSKSNYTLTTEEIYKGISICLFRYGTTVKHNRGKMPNSYKYRPTSQCVSIKILKELKGKFVLIVEQLSSN